MKHFFLSLFCAFSLMAFAQTEKFCTRIFDPNIKTLQMKVANKDFSLPVIELDGKAVLTVSFDELSHNAHLYNYRVLHCNADWSLSSIVTTEFLNGFTTGDITDYALSVNTIVHYTNYKFNLPNETMQFRISGNYLVQIFEDGNAEKIVAQACFSVVEPRVKIAGKVRGNTDTELSGKLQQLDFDVDISGYSVREPRQEVKVVVRQNERLDNAVENLLPTYFSASKLQYINNRNLIFEGGNEYHRFDISSVYQASYGLENMMYNGEIYEAFLNAFSLPISYSHEPDVNGKFRINFQEAFSDSETEGDYIKVHFAFQSKDIFLDGNVFVIGGFNYNLPDENAKMRYDFASKTYVFSTLLKQGGYNYQYLFLPKGKTAFTATRTDGSFWQTQNEYTIYVYHHAWGERYDKLVGVEVIN